MSIARQMSARVHDYAADALLVLVLWLLTLWGVGSQWWTGMNAPDSQFSASLAIFGDQINERALDSGYYWTRLGYLGPVHWLIEIFGIWNGFAIWRSLILLLIVVSVYCVARQFSSRAISSMLTMFIALNTMVLSYAGNPYATGTAMAASLILFALALTQFKQGTISTRRRLLLYGFVTGGVLAWLLMLNPYNAFLAGTTWLGVRAVGIWLARPGIRALIIEAWALIAGFMLVSLGFLLWGRLLFPELNWFHTYRAWNSRLDYASFISDTHIWLHDAAAVVVLLAFLISVAAIILVRNRWSMTALIMSSITIIFTLAYMQVIPGPWIEAPHYAAMCWPGALLSIVLAIGAITEQRQTYSLLWLGLPALIVSMVWAGHASAILSMTQGILLVLAAVLLMLLSTLTRAWSHQLPAWLLVIATVIALGVCAQWLQNGRGNLGIYSQYPMNAAYVDYQTEALMRSNVDAETFLLGHTTADDRVAIWTDPRRLTATAAAMQLWGAYNNVPGAAELNLADQKALRDLKPTVIAMYAPARAQIDHYFATIPARFTPTPPECTTVPYLGIGSPVAHLCLTHIRVQ